MEVGKWTVNRSSSKKALASGKRGQTKRWRTGARSTGKTLVSGDLTRSEVLTMGIAKIPPAEALHEHRHRQAEIYLLLEGTALVTIAGKTRPVAAGSAVFIPGNALHSCQNTGTSDLRVAYVFAADSFEEVEYVFDE